MDYAHGLVHSRLLGDDDGSMYDDFRGNQGICHGSAISFSLTSMGLIYSNHNFGISWRMKMNE